VERRAQAQITQRVRQIGKAFVALRAGLHRHPQDGARALAETGGERRAVQRSLAKTVACAGTVHTGNSSVFCQMMGSFGACTSSTLRTGTRFMPNLKPNIPAASLSPSRIT